MISHSANAKRRKNQQIPIAKREKRAWCQNRRFAAGNVLKKICKIAELPQRKHGFRSTNAQKLHRRISDSWVLLLGTRRGKNPSEHDTHVLQGLEVLASAVNLSGSEILYRPVFGSKFGSKNEAMQDFAQAFFSGQAQPQK